MDYFDGRRYLGYNNIRYINLLKAINRVIKIETDNMSS